jgi:hydrogenase maturation protease
MRSRILVAGIGNIFLGDDAFGSEVARLLLLKPWPDYVRVEDFGIRGFDLAFALMDAYDPVILVDATPRGDVPGTLYTIEPDLSELDSPASGATAIEPHVMNPLSVLRAARSMGAEFRRVILIGCEPSLENMDPDGPGYMGLSEPVRSVLDEAVNLVEVIVARCAVDGSQNKSATGGI